MRKHLIWSGLVGLLCFAAGFGSRTWASRNVGSYAIGGTTVSFDRRSPTYGLPLAEYVSVLLMLHSEEHTNAIERLEVLLDGSALDAEQRSKILSPQEMRVLGRCLTQAAEYRTRYPRQRTGTSDVFWSAARQSEVDDFLGGFATEKAAH